jgi:putative membrane protein insertion efficiency factor
VLIRMIRLYQAATAHFPPVCRFTPSCSAYAIQAIERHGPVKGMWLAARRILRCNPFTPGGHDPVP